MGKLFSDRIVTAIDIGTTKICVIIAQHLDNGRVEILGIGKSPSDGLRKGVVVDVGKTIYSIKTAVKEAELMAGFAIESAYIGISGGHIQSLNSQGIVPIKRGEIRLTDIENVMSAARAIPIPEGQQILHVLPQYFVIDGHERVHYPLGMHGIRLEVNTHIILGAIASVQNLVKCCEMAGIKVKDIILEQLASAQAVLSPDERELGIAVLDIGGGTSDLALYQHGNIRHTMVLPVAGNHFTNDVAVGLRTTLKEAERIKHAYGYAALELLEKDELIEIEMVQGNQKHIVCVSELVGILEPRARELLVLVHKEITKHKLQPFMPAGLVLTGGSSLLRGMHDVAHKIFDIPVRIGHVRVTYDLPESLSSPMYATGYGLILYAVQQMHKELPGDTTQGPLSKRIAARMKSWVSDFF
ncbi:MAG TPA: cell division protein FtsA [Candidatus Limnocylindria bacterium]|nr:cell division protein FtsA [Candidatus Limnocylindria bacterium]